jgi:outer membrane protein
MSPTESDSGITLRGKLIALGSIVVAVVLAIAHRPDVIAALGELDAAQASLKAAQRAYRPTIGLSAHVFQNIGASRSDGGSTSTIDHDGGNILFSFSIPLFDGGERASQISIARAKLRASEADLAQRRDDVAQQVVRAYDELLTTLAEYDAAQTVLRAADTSYDAALRSYQQGVGTYTEVATEENAVADAQRQVEDARAGAHTAAAGLAFAMGLNQM